MRRLTALILVVTICLLTIFQQTVIAQDTTLQQTAIAKDSTKTKKEFKNNIHFNITNPLIFGSRSIIFGYERVLNKRRSFTINFGQTDFPSLNIINSDSLRANALISQKGFHVSVDYRFYLAKENKYNAPRGIYIGPYFSYNYFEKKHGWDLKSNSSGNTLVESTTSLVVSTLGFELGYQFVFWNRLSLDLIMAGPGISSYKLKAAIGGNLSEEDRQKFFQKLNEALADKFPGYSVAIDESEFKKNGSTNTTNLGFRYLIQLGFRF